MLAPLSRSSHLELTLELDPSLKAQEAKRALVWLDSLRVLQCMANLLSNAIKVRQQLSVLGLVRLTSPVVVGISSLRAVPFGFERD